MGISAAVARCSGILALLSILLVTEGVSRINLFIGTPGGQWGGDYLTYPPAVLLTASVGLTFFGLAGLANSLYVLLLGIGSSAVTFVLLIVEGVLGWFFFSVFVLSSYPFMVARAAGPMPGLNDTQSNALIMMAYLGAFGIGVPILADIVDRCRSLLMHLTAHRSFVRLQSKKEEAYDEGYVWNRVYFYAILVLLRGIGETAAGSIVYANLTSGRLSASIADVPFIITWPSINIAEGVFVLVISILALVIAAARIKALAVPFAALSFFCFVVQLALYATTQIGVNAKNPLIVGAILTVDSFVAMFMPAYLILEAARVGNLKDDEQIEMPASSKNSTEPIRDAVPLTA
ncbi:g6007 [Coccomyxa elongata]